MLASYHTKIRNEHDSAIRVRVIRLFAVNSILADKEQKRVEGINLVVPTPIAIKIK